MFDPGPRPDAPRQAPAEMNERWRAVHRNPESNRPDGSLFPVDDRPMIVRPTGDGRFDTLRADDRFVEGGQMVARSETREQAEFEAERWAAIVPSTDSSRQARSRATFYGFNVPDGLFDR